MFDLEHLLKQTFNFGWVKPSWRDGSLYGIVHSKSHQNRSSHSLARNHFVFRSVESHARHEPPISPDKKGYRPAKWHSLRIQKWFRAFGLQKQSWQHCPSGKLCRPAKLCGPHPPSLACFSRESARFDIQIGTLADPSNVSRFAPSTIDHPPTSL